MVVDTSVVLQVFLEEKGWEETVVFLLQQEARLFSAASLVEAQAVVAGRTTVTAEESRGLLDDLLTFLKLELVPLSVEQGQLAREAYLKFGKGQGRGAGLNFGDVLVYGLAKDRGEVLAFVGDDFSRTDLKVVKLPYPSR